jgi:hypothetical protein
MINKFVPKLYQHAPWRPTQEGFLRVIEQTEAKNNRPVKRARQSEIFNILLAQSRKAEAEVRRMGRRSYSMGKLWAKIARSKAGRTLRQVW